MEKIFVVPSSSHTFFLKNLSSWYVFFKVNGINELEQLTGGLWGAGKDLVVPSPSHTFFIHVEWVVCVFKVNGNNELE